VHREQNPVLKKSETEKTQAEEVWVSERVDEMGW
jgi:hypothetical protein